MLLNWYLFRSIDKFSFATIKWTRHTTNLRTLQVSFCRDDNGICNTHFNKHIKLFKGNIMVVYTPRLSLKNSPVKVCRTYIWYRKSIRTTAGDESESMLLTVWTSPAVSCTFTRVTLHRDKRTNTTSFASTLTNFVLIKASWEDG